MVSDIAEYDGSSLVLFLILERLLGLELDRVVEVETGHSDSIIVLTDWKLHVQVQ